MKKNLFFSRGLKKTLQNMSSVAVRWFVLETADRKAKSTCTKGNVSPKPCSQYFGCGQNIIFSGPFQNQKQGFSLAICQLEMVVYHAASWREQQQPELQYLCHSCVFPKLLCFWTIREVSAMFCLVPELRVVSMYREHPNQKSGN